MDSPVLRLVLLLSVAAAATAMAMVDDAHYADNALDPLDPNVAAYDELDTELDTRMVGGDVVTENTSYSFMVAVQPRFSLNGVETRAPLCSGVLIKGRVASTAAGATTWTDQNYVLTSAHCALSGTTYDLYAGAKRITTQDPSDTVDATDAVIHDEYRQTQMTGDLALIPTSIAESNSANPVSVATLASVNDATKSYLINTVAMAGWGYPNDVFNAPSPSLRQLSSWVVPNWYCAVRHLSLPIKRTHMCTAGMPNKGPCTGDSGAPLIAQAANSNGNANSGGSAARVIGVATFTPADGCSRGRPGVFTRLGEYLSWVQQVANYDPEQA